MQHSGSGRCSLTSPNSASRSATKAPEIGKFQGSNIIQAAWSTVSNYFSQWWRGEPRLRLELNVPDLNPIKNLWVCEETSSVTQMQQLAEPEVRHPQVWDVVTPADHDSRWVCWCSYVANKHWQSTWRSVWHHRYNKFLSVIVRIYSCDLKKLEGSLPAWEQLRCWCASRL